jgi:hypothetical protein
MHDRVDAANIGVFPRGEVGNGKSAVWEDNAGVKRASLSVFQAAFMGNRVFRRRGIVPPDCHVAGDRHGFRHEIGRPVLNSNLRIRRCGLRWPRAEESTGDDRHYEEKSCHGFVSYPQIL